MKRLLLVVGAAVLGTSVAVFLVLQANADGDFWVPAPSSAEGSLVLDVHGATIEQLPAKCENSRYPYFCQYVRSELGKIDKSLLRRKGLTIKTTLDQRMQQASQQAINTYVSHDDKVVATQAMIIPGSGEIRAMAISRGLAKRSGHQQGSTAMVYTLAAALESGMRYEDGFPASEEYRASDYVTFKDCKGQSVADPSHTVRNHKPSSSVFTTLQKGTSGEVNTFFVRLQEKVGLCQTVQMARRLGLSRTDGAKLQEVETFTLGVNESDPVIVANSYATLAARGLRCTPRSITEIWAGSDLLRDNPRRCEQVLDPAVADAVTGVLSTGPTRAFLNSIDRDVAAMPGTTDNFASAWYAGYTPSLASAVSLGVDPRPGEWGKLTNVSIGGRHYPQVYGVMVPGPIWKTSMMAALALTPQTSFVKADASRFGGCQNNCRP
ncbi:hypothetical protein GCM10009733_082790 [Nonomuraea maheshkhaliensis]|uniref:Penicillin-binding protein n=1 Tax=Nonomuraea maheshkhaliensis TaxID=419590 RepID=A0ABP4SHP2_9ACTN